MAASGGCGEQAGERCCPTRHHTCDRLHRFWSLQWLEWLPQQRSGPSAVMCPMLRTPATVAAASQILTLGRRCVSPNSFAPAPSAAAPYPQDSLQKGSAPARLTLQNPRFLVRPVLCSLLSKRLSRVQEHRTPPCRVGYPCRSSCPIKTPRPPPSRGLLCCPTVAKSRSTHTQVSFLSTASTPSSELCSASPARSPQYTPVVYWTVLHICWPPTVKCLPPWAPCNPPAWPVSQTRPRRSHASRLHQAIRPLSQACDQVPEQLVLSPASACLLASRCSLLEPSSSRLPSSPRTDRACI